MDALNLEMSETFKQGELKKALEKGKGDEIIAKGKLLDSLDLNTGFDAFQKQKEETTLKMPTINKRRPINYLPKEFNKQEQKDEKKVVKEVDLRDSLEEADFSREIQVIFNK